MNTHKLAALFGIVLISSAASYYLGHRNAIAEIEDLKGVREQLEDAKHQFRLRANAMWSLVEFLECKHKAGEDISMALEELKGTAAFLKDGPKYHSFKY